MEEKLLKTECFKQEQLQNVGEGMHSLVHPSPLPVPYVIMSNTHQYLRRVDLVGLQMNYKQHEKFEKKNVSFQKLTKYQIAMELLCCYGNVGFEETVPNNSKT